MAHTLATAELARHRVLPETAKGSEAKAHLRKADVDEAWKPRVGAMVREVRIAVGWTLNELSGKVRRDERQIARWERGEETPQIDRYLAVPELRLPLALAVAKLAGEGVEVETIVRVRRFV